MKKTIITALASALALASAPAFAVSSIAGATFPQQIVQELTAVQQLAQQAQEVQQQIQMVMNQAQNLKSMPTQMWSSAQGDISQLISVASTANGLSYAGQNIYGQFNQTYGQNGIPPLNSSYSQSLQGWSSDTNGQISSMLQQYHLNAQQFATEQGALQGVENASQSAVGRMQVLQAANQIAGMEVNQTQALQQDVMAGNSAMGSYMAQRTSAQEKGQEDEQSFMQQNNADMSYSDPLQAPMIQLPGGN
ncbi:P-type conjugative transfer protein TrbJ [Acidithiobacillus sp. MC6.1]|nr:P-type conjugative transfer protein TrbJ [Acidithiobacillus sp. MC6.1]